MQYQYLSVVMYQGEQGSSEKKEEKKFCIFNMWLFV